MSYDELELDTLGDRKTALFLIMSDTDSTFNFVIAMLQSQLFNLLCDKADDEYGGKLPVHVRCLLDEFANIGQIYFVYVKGFVGLYDCRTGGHIPFNVKSVFLVEVGKV